MIKPSHRTLTTRFLDAENLKKLKNNLKSSGIKIKQMNHYLQTTYRIINDLESAQAEHRWYPKFVRPAHKEYVNTVEFVRLVAEIVSKHILNAVCGGSEGSSKADDNGIAERLLNELLSYTGAADKSTSNHIHGDHIRLGVVNAVAELLTTAKETGGLPGNMNTAKTTLSPEAEAERRRRGVAATALLASGKHNYNYCDTIKSSPRTQTSQNKKYEVPKFVKQKSNYRHTVAIAKDEKRTSQDSVKNKANSRAVIKAPFRSKLDKSANRKEPGTENTENVTRNVRLKKTIDSRTEQKRLTNVIKTNYASKVGEGVKSRNSRNIFAMKTRNPIPQQMPKQSKAVSGVNSKLQKNIFKRKPVTVDETDKAHKVQIKKTIDSSIHKKRPTNGIEAKNPPNVDAQKTVGEDVKSGINKIGDNYKNIMRSQKQSNARKTADGGILSGNSKIEVNAVSNRRSQKRSRATMKDNRKKTDDPVPAFTTDNNRKPVTFGALQKEVVRTSGTRGNIDLSANVEENNKHRMLFNSKRNILRANGVAGKSTETRNINLVVKKSKNFRTRNGVSKPRVVEKRDKTTLLETSTSNGIKELVNTEKIFSVSETIDTPRTSADVRDDVGGGGGKMVVPSETQISPAIDYHDDASLMTPQNRINEPIDTKKIFSVSETIDTPRTSADVRDDVGGGGGKMVVPSETQISPAIDYHDDASLMTPQNRINEPIDTKKIFSVSETIDTPRTSADVRDDVGGGGGKMVVPSETQISPAIDYHDDASLMTPQNRINEPIDTKKIFSVSETIDTPRTSADVRDDVGGGGGKMVVPLENQISPAIDYRDDASITNTRDWINEPIDTMRIFSAAETIDNLRTPVDVRDDDRRETGRNCISERNQDETENKTTKPSAMEAGSRRTNNRCMDDDIYKLRMTCVVGQLDQCLNQVSYESYCIIIKFTILSSKR